MFEKHSRMSLFKKKDFGHLGHNKIKLVDEFEVTIPNYKFKNILDNRCNQGWFQDAFERQLKETFFKDGTFNNVSHELIARKTYVIKIFRIGKWEEKEGFRSYGPKILEEMSVETSDCLTFLEQQGSYLVGLQGLVLLGDCIDNKILKDKPIISLDIDENLMWGAFSRIPILGCADGEKYFDFGEGIYPFDPGVHLLCVTDFEPHFM